MKSQLVNKHSITEKSALGRDEKTSQKPSFQTYQAIGVDTDAPWEHPSAETVDSTIKPS